jgi:uncharacterized membrane protein YsdA (DUF1294 family)/cold shock CspA family protein
MAPGFCKGQLLKWNDDRGFGFIKPANGGSEVFLHISEIKDATRPPILGDSIYYLVAKRDKKIHAYDAFIVGARLKPTSLPSPKQTPSVNKRAPASKRKNSSNKSAFLSPLPLGGVWFIATFPLLGALHFAVKTGNPLPLILYAVMGWVSYRQYANDKRFAQQGDWRIPEKTLILCDLACGWIGGFIAQKRLHHKTSKTSYQLAFFIVVGMHYIFWLGWILMGKGIGLWN